MRRAVAALCTLLLVSAACSAPPQKEIDRAQGAIDAARAAGAEHYAPEPFKAATTAMQQTHEAVQQREYRLALSRATDANERALEAAEQAANGKARARGDAEAAITHLAATIRQLEERLKVAEAARMPAQDLKAVRGLHADATRALQEARKTHAAGDYLGALAAARGLPDRITSEIRTLNEAVETRTGRGRGRRR